MVPKEPIGTLAFYKWSCLLVYTELVFCLTPKSQILPSNTNLKSFKCSQSVSYPLFFPLIIYPSPPVNSSLIKAMAVLLLQYHVKGYQHTTQLKRGGGGREERVQKKIQLQPPYTSTFLFLSWPTQPPLDLFLMNPTQLWSPLQTWSAHLNPTSVISSLSI